MYFRRSTKKLLAKKYSTFQMDGSFATITTNEINLVSYANNVAWGWPRDHNLSTKLTSKWHYNSFFTSFTSMPTLLVPSFAEILISYIRIPHTLLPDAVYSDRGNKKCAWLNHFQKKHKIQWIFEKSPVYSNIVQTLSTH